MLTVSLCVGSWDVRLAALKNYYGTPKTSIFPFAFLNPGGYFSNVTFWVNALKDYELGKVSTQSMPGRLLRAKCLTDSSFLYSTLMRLLPTCTS